MSEVSINSKDRFRWERDKEEKYLNYAEDFGPKSLKQRSMIIHSQKKTGRDSRPVNWRHTSGNGRKRNTKEREILADHLHGRRK